MADPSPFADPPSDDSSGYAWVDEFQSPEFLRRLQTWTRWTKTCGRMCIAVGIVSIGTSVLRLLNQAAEGVPNDDWTPIFAALAFVLLAVATVFGLPGLFLIQAARRTEHYLQTDDPEQLVSGFRTLSHFWLTIGILIALLIVATCLIPLALA